MKSSILFILSLLGAQCAWAGLCHDVSKGAPESLNGRLTYAVYPGPPNYQSVEKGDTPEGSYVLVLDSDICIRGDDFGDPQLGRREATQ